METYSQDDAAAPKSATPPPPAEPADAAVTPEPTVTLASPTAVTATHPAPPPKPPVVIPPAPSTSTSNAGRYRLDQCVGKGGFGEVWKGYDPVLDLVVAIKLPRADREFSQAESDQFVEEARKQAKLNHPAIVKIRHAEREASSWLIVSDYIDGVSLRERMALQKFTVAESVQLAADIADALHAAHRQRLIHRDVKPANILLDKAGRPFLTDFGLALSEDEQHHEKNSIAGTWAYMSPEQIRGEAHLLDGRTDIYSLGIVLYELLTGERPFRGQGFEEYREQVLNRPPKPPRLLDESIPKELERICLKCLAKSAAERYATAADLAVDLRRSERPKTRWWLAATAAAILIALVLAFFVAGPWLFPSAKIDEIPKVEEKTKSDEKLAPVATPVRPSRDGWMPLWERDPLPLVWPKRVAGSLLERREREESIWALCEGDGIFKIGEAREPSYVFRVYFKSLKPGAFIGVLLGHRYVTRKSRELAQFEMFRLIQSVPGASSNFKLSHFTCEYSEVHGGMPDGIPWSHAPIDFPQREVELEIAVANNRLASVRWDSRILSQIKEPTPEEKTDRSWQGNICIYLRDAIVHLRRPELALK